MRPTPIPDHEVWDGAVRKVVGDDDLINSNIAPVESLIWSPPSGGLNLSVRCELEPGELEKLQAGGMVWLTFGGGMLPWNLTVADPNPAP